MSVPEGKEFDKSYPISEKENTPSEDLKARIKKNQKRLKKKKQNPK
jgi:hypothetical protein